MGKYNIEIEPALIDIMPSFIELTDQDMDALASGIDSEDWEAIKKLAHTLKGDSGGYGFDEMSNISKELEIFAEGKDLAQTRGQFEILKEYWKEVKETFNSL